MTQVLVRYKAKPEHIAGNDQVVRAVHDELQRTVSSGSQNATLQAGDGVTQVHMASTESDNGQTRRTRLDASGGSRTPTTTVVISPDRHPAARDRLPADTVKKHVSHLLGKLGAANRTEAVTRARQLGLIP